MEIRQLRYFVALAKYESFTKAAKELFITQPTLSQQISSLENSIGLILIDRASRVFKLTEAGNFFLAESVKLLSQYDCFRMKLDNYKLSQNYVLKLSTLETLETGFMPYFLSVFSKNHPDIKISSTSGIFSDLIRDINELKTDISIGITFTNKTYDQLSILRLRKEDDVLAIVVPENNKYHNITSFDQTQICELLKQHCHLFDGWGDYEFALSAIKKITGVLPEISYYDNITRFMLNAYDWNGYTILPKKYLHHIKGDTVCSVIPILDSNCLLDCSVIYNPVNENPCVNIFVKELADFFMLKQ